MVYFQLSKANLRLRNCQTTNGENPTSVSREYSATALVDCLSNIPKLRLRALCAMRMCRLNDLDPMDRPRKRSSVEFRQQDMHVLPGGRHRPRHVSSSNSGFSLGRRVSPSSYDRTSDSTTCEELKLKRSGGGPDGRPSIHFSQDEHVTVRSSSTLGQSYGDECNFRKGSCLADFQLRALKRTIDHPAWIGTTLILILVILFGPAIRDIWLPKTVDGAVDGVLTIAFAFLLVDIIIRCFVDRDYFTWNIKTRDLPENNCRMGSFRFWFDMVRTPYSSSSYLAAVHSRIILQSPTSLQAFSAAHSVRDFVYKSDPADAFECQR